MIGVNSDLRRLWASAPLGVTPGTNDDAGVAVVVVLEEAVSDGAGDADVERERSMPPGDNPRAGTATADEVNTGCKFVVELREDRHSGAPSPDVPLGAGGVVVTELLLVVVTAGIVPDGVPVPDAACLSTGSATATRGDVGKA